MAAVAPAGSRRRRLERGPVAGDRHAGRRRGGTPGLARRRRPAHRPPDLLVRLERARLRPRRGPARAGVLGHHPGHPVPRRRLGSPRPSSPPSCSWSNRAGSRPRPCSSGPSPRSATSWPWPCWPCWQQDHTPAGTRRRSRATPDPRTSGRAPTPHLTPPTNDGRAKPLEPAATSAGEPIRPPPTASRPAGPPGRGARRQDQGRP